MRISIVLLILLLTTSCGIFQVSKFDVTIQSIEWHPLGSCRVTIAYNVTNGYPSRKNYKISIMQFARPFELDNTFVTDGIFSTEFNSIPEDVCHNQVKLEEVKE